MAYPAPSQTSAACEAGGWGAQAGQAGGFWGNWFPGAALHRQPRLPWHGAAVCSPPDGDAETGGGFASLLQLAGRPALTWLMAQGNDFPARAPAALRAVKKPVPILAKKAPVVPVAAPVVLVKKVPGEWGENLGQTLSGRALAAAAAWEARRPASNLP